MLVIVKGTSLQYGNQYLMPSSCLWFWWNAYTCSCSTEVKTL